LEADLKKYEQDLSRLRSTRDSLQRAIDLQTAKESTESHQLQEIKTLANTRTDRINALISEVARLKMKMAADAGQTALMAAYDDSIEEPYESLNKKLEEKSNEINDLKNILEKLQNQNNTNVTTY
jgi:E3 ubiquitin-protein ligase BRE1